MMRLYIVWMSRTIWFRTWIENPNKVKISLLRVMIVGNKCIHNNKKNNVSQHTLSFVNWISVCVCLTVCSMTLSVVLRVVYSNYTIRLHFFFLSFSFGIIIIDSQNESYLLVVVRCAVNIALFSVLNMQSHPRWWLSLAICSWVYQSCCNNLYLRTSKRLVGHRNRVACSTSSSHVLHGRNHEWCEYWPAL